MPLGTYFGLRILKHFWSKHLNQFSIKVIHKDIIQNLNKCWAQNVSISQEAECFNTPILYTADTHFYNSSVKIGFIYLCSSSDKQKFHRLLECYDIGINSSLFKCFVFFKFYMLDKEVVLTREKIQTICLTKKLF